MTLCQTLGCFFTSLERRKSFEVQIAFLFFGGVTREAILFEQRADFFLVIRRGAGQGEQATIS